jgi:hypothetical protein
MKNSMRKRPLYEHRLADVLYEIDERTRVQRPYKRVVVKMKTRKKKRKNGKPMTRARMFAGWNEAAAAFYRKNPVTNLTSTVRRPSITPDQYEQIHQNTLLRAKRTLNQPLKPTDDLRGLEFGLLLAWNLSADTTAGIRRYHCLCACGKPCVMSAGGLVNGRHKHCGHRLRDKRRQERKRKRQRLADEGRQRARWKRHWGMN